MSCWRAVRRRFFVIKGQSHIPDMKQVSLDDARLLAANHSSQEWLLSGRVALTTAASCCAAIRAQWP